MPAASHFPHWLADFQQALDRGNAEGDQNLWFDYFNLLNKVGQAGFHLPRGRRTISKCARRHIRPAF
jgi:hypothetical protein